MNDMTRVKNTTFISAYENIAPDDYCDRMISAFRELETSRVSTFIGSVNNGAGKRKDYSYFFNQHQNVMFNTMELTKETNIVLDEALKLYVEEYPSLEPLSYYSTFVKVQRTPPKGGFHTWHCEHGSAEASGRMLTWTIYLNDVPDGEGETEFLEYGVKVKAKKGTVSFFPASWTHTHRGNAVYTHDKFIATGWYYVLGT
tara:strand:+ start:54 stop:653 length:600 start_codon:yes stop_codon:yes gene_type:complete